MSRAREVTCKHCHKSFELDIPRSWVRCPHCGNGFAVRRGSGQEQEQAPAASAAAAAPATDTRAPDSERAAVSLSEIELAATERGDVSTSSVEHSVDRGS